MYSELIADIPTPFILLEEVGRTLDSFLHGLPRRAAAWIDRHRKVAAAVFIVGFIIILPRPAYADAILDGLGKLVDNIGNFMLTPFRDAMIDTIAGHISSTSRLADMMLEPAKHTIPLTDGATHTLSGFSGNESALLAADSSLPLKEVLVYVVKIYNVIKPICYTILGLVFAIQFVKIIQQPDNPTGGVPYVEKFAWMWIKFAVLKLLLDNSIDISVAIFNFFAEIGKRIADVGPFSSDDIEATVRTTLENNFSNTQLGGEMVNLIFLFFGLIVVFIVAILIFVSVYGRWLQIFIYLPFAPLFFAFLGEDETKQMFWSYVRSIAGAGLAMVITIILVRSLPAILTISTLGDSRLGTIGIWGSEILLGWAVMHAGQWAHDMIGS